MNRISDEQVKALKDALGTGRSLRQAAASCKVHIETVRRFAAMEGIDMSRAPRKTEVSAQKLAYCKNYHANRDYMKSFLLRNYMRAFLAELLAKASTPLTLDEVFCILKSNYPTATKSGTALMLHNNADRMFLKLGSHWTFQPATFIPSTKDLRVKTWAWRKHWYAARAAWFDRYGLRDEWMECCIQRLLDRQREHLSDVQVKIAEKSKPFFAMTGGAMAIASAAKTP